MFAVFSLSFLLQMVFGVRCMCSKHDAWRQERWRSVMASDLRVAAFEELRFCEVDTSKNKGRKREIGEAFPWKNFYRTKVHAASGKLALNVLLSVIALVEIIFCMGNFVLSHVVRLKILLRSHGDIQPGIK